MEGFEQKDQFIKTYYVQNQNSGMLKPKKMIILKLAGAG